MLGAFLKLTDYRIIWQPVETNEVPNADHILPTQWVPQTDILAHPKTVAFVTHMGYKSFREGLCAQVPLVAMPVFAEQYFNAAVVLQKGLGVFLNKMDTSTEAVYNALRRVLNDPAMKQRMSRFSSQVNDRLMEPVDLATFWINFLLRRKNVATTFLRQKGGNLSMISQNSIDVVLLISSFFGILFITVQQSE
uniref:glucuronosyltransferase n=1 Tax=Trichuris muris TaxID=70415 RepID=A0A5S6QIV5_TRIMR